jgi:hypothetical protein
MLVGAHLEPFGTLLAAVAGALVAVVLMNGPLWLLVPGALGALLPVLLSRMRSRGDARSSRPHRDVVR